MGFGKKGTNKMITKETTLKDAVTKLNEAVADLSGYRFYYSGSALHSDYIKNNFSDFHKTICEKVSPIIENPLKYTIWGIEPTTGLYLRQIPDRNVSQHIFDYRDKTFVQDKRFPHEKIGKCGKVEFTYNNGGLWQHAGFTIPDTYTVGQWLDYANEMYHKQRYINSALRVNEQLKELQKAINFATVATDDYTKILKASGIPERLKDKA